MAINWDIEGYTSLLILFETAENICKSIIGDYKSSFYNIVERLKEQDIITDNEKIFLSKNKFSLRRIRNIFAHDNLSKFNIIRQENGKKMERKWKENILSFIRRKLFIVI